MATKKYQIFVSSTFRDLIEERQDAIKNILHLRHIPTGMEFFPASDIDQLTYIKKIIDECDYYVLIVAGRYGSIDAEGISYTEREYEYALATGKVVLAFLHSDPESIPMGKSDINPVIQEALNNFRAKVSSGRLVQMWKTRQELESLVLKALVQAIDDKPQIGWIRADAIASEQIVEQNNKLLLENIDLK